MISRTFQINLLMSDFWRSWPLTVITSSPLSSTTPAIGTISETTEPCSMSLPKSHGRPFSRATSCRSRRVMSSPQA